jgi:hypothetical protein
MLGAKHDSIAVRQHPIYRLTVGDSREHCWASQQGRKVRSARHALFNIVEDLWGALLLQVLI